MKNVILTTMDIDREYEICGLVSSHISEIGWNNIRSVRSFKDMYMEIFVEMDVYKGPEIAFKIECEEVKKRALELNADAVIGIKFTHNTFFNGGSTVEDLYTMYGTAVKFK